MQQRLRDLMAATPSDALPTMPTSMWQLVQRILMEYMQSQRILIEWGSAVAVAAILIRNATNTHTMMATWSLYSILVALYTTSVLADIAEQPFQMQRLLAIQSRRAYISAYLIAANIIVVSSYIIIVIVSFLTAPLARPTLELFAASLPSILVLISFVTTLMLMLTPLVANTQQRIIVLLLITIPLSWNILGPAIQRFIGTEYSTLIAVFTTIWGLLLWPSLHLYTITITPQIDRMMVVVIVFHLILLTVIIRQIIYWFNKKSLAIA
jgi:hypothetical protein